MHQSSYTAHSEGIYTDTKCVLTKGGKHHRKQKGDVNSTLPQSKAVPIPKTTAQFSANWKVLSKDIIPANAIRLKRRRTTMERTATMEEGGFAIVHAKGKKPKLQLPKEFLNEFGLLEYSHYGQLKHCAEDQVNEFFKKHGRYVAIDCEMVGVDLLKTDALARVSIVNEYGYCILDTFVKPKLPVTDYRTEFSGVRVEDLLHAPCLDDVMKRVSEIIKGKILIGHALQNDLDVLYIQHPRFKLRDTARYFRKKGGRTPSLKLLAETYLNAEIQTGEHSSIQDAQAAMKLYLLHRKPWEKSMQERRRR